MKRETYDPTEDHESVSDEFEEHGDDWRQCSACGATWAVVECATEAGEEYQDLEEIAAGDGSCAERKCRQ